MASVIIINVYICCNLQGEYVMHNIFSASMIKKCWDWDMVRVKKLQWWTNMCQKLRKALRTNFLWWRPILIPERLLYCNGTTSYLEQRAPLTSRKSPLIGNYEKSFPYLSYWLIAISKIIWLWEPTFSCCNQISNKQNIINVCYK